MSNLLGPIKTGITIQSTTPEPEPLTQKETLPPTGYPEQDAVVPFAENQQSLFSDQAIDQNVSLGQLLTQKTFAEIVTAVQQRLDTGAGDDNVQIAFGDDGLVHVNVNGKDAWSGTVVQFQNLIIDTGDGDDIVTNYVDGAVIATGRGDDQVLNMSNGSEIHTESGDDRVLSSGNNNQITTGSGDDRLVSHGDLNILQTEGGEDAIWVHGDRNVIDTGSSNDGLSIEGEQNTVDGVGPLR